MVFNPGDLVSTDFPGVTGMKRRPTVILSSTTYHAIRPDSHCRSDYFANEGVGIDGLYASGLSRIGITSCISISEFYCHDSSLCQYYENWSVVRAGLESRPYLCQSSAC